MTDEKEIKKRFKELLGNLKKQGKQKVKEPVLIGKKRERVGAITRNGQKSARILGDSFIEFFDNFSQYQNVQELTFSHVLIDNLIFKENRSRLEKLKKLSKLTFECNNVTEYLELINFENIQNLTHLNLIDNPVTESDMLRYFVFYRFSKLEQFNQFPKTEEELEKTKEIYLDFDKILQKLHKINFTKFKLQNSDKQRISKKIAESFIQSLQVRKDMEDNFDQMFDAVIDSYVDSIL